MNRVSQQNVEVLVNDKPVKIHAHEGKLFVEGKAGSEYKIRVKNDAWQRVLAVASVDSINVISGELATDEGAGYIVSGRGAYTIQGFRVSDEEVNTFAFGKKEKSYAAKSEATEGSTRDCGVIGVKFFYEKTKPAVYRKSLIPDDTDPVNRPWKSPRPYEVPRIPWPEPSIFSCVHDGPSDGDMGTQKLMMSASFDDEVERSAPIPRRINASVLRSAPRDFDLGTVFTDKKVEDKVTTVEFERGAVAEFVEIFYASREVLESMGIQIEKKPSVAFPSSFKPSGYCKPPK